MSPKAVLSALAAATLIFVLFLNGTGLAPNTGSASESPGPVPAADLPLAEDGYALGDPLGAYEDAMMSGGPPPDGIPSIDEPVFLEASEADLEPGAMVIGYVRNGDARAYPHRILVHHEIVNDRVAGQNIAITYCPLTATAQGFQRGSTTLGVSGQLVNSNLVMYDRDTESYFPQIAATGITGELQGETLREVDLVWTTWERWLAAHPDTRVLSEDTGYLRNYDRDPYGSYNPRGGYYDQNRTLFPLMHRSERLHPKEMVVGARTPETSAYFVLDRLREEQVQSTDHFVAVYDPKLDRGHIYLRNEGGTGAAPGVTPRGDGRYEVEGEIHAAGELPLEAVIPIKGFFFAWNAFFPDSETP